MKPTQIPSEKKPRIVSPEIAALRAEHKAKVEALHVATLSAAILKRITEDLLPKLTLDANRNSAKLSTMKTKEPMFDAIAVNIATNIIRIYGENKTKRNAEAISAMAVMRQGCDERFYIEVPHGIYKDGDIYRN